MLAKRLFYHLQKLHLSFRRNYADKNLLSLNERGFFQDIFPDNASAKIRKLFNSKPQTVYAGFDPTADSLHIGNLLVIMGLLHCQRGGHQPIALLGGATGIIGDPSGRTTERSKLASENLTQNLSCIQSQIERVFANHRKYFCTDSKMKTVDLKDVKIVNNAHWYADTKLIDFIGTVGRHFRMGSMLSRSSVQSRLQSESGMSFTEFTYQMFQAYDWLHLFQKHECTFQLGGSDQMGNLMSGHELIGRVTKKDVYGLTLPIITNEEGDKFGKSAGNAIWLAEERTSPFSLYQYFIRVADSEVEQLLKLLTFLPLSEIDSLMQEHRKVPELREAQRKLAREITLLIHAETGLAHAESISAALYKGSVEALGNLSQRDVRDSFGGATICDIFQEPGMTVLDVAMKANCFPTERDAIRIITAGGFHINQNRAKNISEVLSPTVHILKNGLTLIRVGKKNYYIVNWVK